MTTGSASDHVEPAVAPPPGNPRFPLFDGLRAIAALSVVVFHTAFYSGAYQASALGPIVARLNIGVAIFFVISGFLIYRPFVAARLDGRGPPAVRDYARRRVLRIVPAYWVALTLLAIYPGLRGVFTGEWPIFYGFAQVYSTDTVLDGISPAWTLGTEIAFYALLPLYAWAVARALRGREAGRAARVELGLLALLAAASVVVRTVASGGDFGTLGLTLPATFAWFAVGMAIAVLSSAAAAGSLRVPAALERATPAWAAAVALYLVLCYSLGAPEGYVFAVQVSYGEALLEFVLSGVVAGLLVLPAAFGWRRGGAPRRLLAAPVMAWLGLVSYGIYLWHHDAILWLIDRGVLDTFSGAPFLALTALAVALTVPIAGLSYYLVERPVLRFKDRRPDRGVSRPERRAAPAGAPAAGAAPGESSGPAGP
jgi:peptidoglycan/LPS O-acetylase OafA/YrhL